MRIVVSVGWTTTAAVVAVVSGRRGNLNWIFSTTIPETINLPGPATPSSCKTTAVCAWFENHLIENHYFLIIFLQLSLSTSTRRLSLRTHLTHKRQRKCLIIGSWLRMGEASESLLNWGWNRIMFAFFEKVSSGKWNSLRCFRCGNEVLGFEDWFLAGFGRSEN